MTTSHVAGGSWVFSASTSTMPAVTLASTTVGDLNVIFVTFKQIGATFTVPSGWVQVLSQSSSANGAVYAAGAGDVSVLAIARVFQAGDVAPTLAVLTGGSTTSTTGNVVGIDCRAFRASGPKTYDIGVATAALNAASTNWGTTYTLGPASAIDNANGIYSTASSSTAAGDVVVGWHGLALTGSTVSAMSFTQTGGSFGTINAGAAGNTPATATSTIGADLQSNAFFSVVNTGGTGALTAAGTYTVSSYGMRAVLRVREASTLSTPPHSIHLPNPAIPASFIR